MVQEIMINAQDLFDEGDPCYEKKMLFITTSEGKNFLRYMKVMQNTRNICN